jgi:ABC-type antimicrobial peptide transport system permease subunit
MTPARWTFVVVFGLGIVLGLCIGITKMVAPDAAHVEFNGAEVTGWTALFTALFSSGIPALIFGLILAGIVALFTRRKKAS